jgi:hypothetical protein
VESLFGFVGGQGDLSGAGEGLIMSLEHEGGIGDLTKVGKVVHELEGQFVEWLGVDVNHARVGICRQ